MYDLLGFLSSIISFDEFKTHATIMIRTLPETSHCFTLNYKLLTINFKKGIHPLYIYNTYESHESLQSLYL